MHAGKTCLLQRRGTLTSHKRVVERVQETTNRDIVTEMTYVMKTRVHDLDFSVTLPADAKVVSMVTLVIDSEAVAVVERMLEELGQVKVVPADVTATRQVYIFKGLKSTPENRDLNTRFFFRAFLWRGIRVSKI